MSLILTLFGDLQVHYGDQQLALPTQRARALLAYVVLHANRPQSRTQLATLLWPESITAQANLRGELPRLRKAIERIDGDRQAILNVDRHYVAFEPHGKDVIVDALRFQELLSQCSAHQHASLKQCASCCRTLTEATMLYRGDLLEDIFVDDSPAFEEWLLLTREYFRRQMVDALEALLDYFEATEQYEKVVQYARRQLALMPWHEHTHRRLMCALVGLGQRGEALAQFQQCRQYLAKEFTVEPEAQTWQLAHTIRSGAPLFARVEAIVPCGERSHHSPLANSTIGTTQSEQPRSVVWDYQLASVATSQTVMLPQSQVLDEAPQAPLLYGRQQPLQDLSQLAIHKCKRVIGLVGMGGVGKSSLAAAFAHAASTTAAPTGFSTILWRSLRNAPPCHLLLAAWLQQLGGQPLPQWQPDLDTQLSLLVQQLRRQRVLLILDNVEAVLTSGQFTGHFEAAHEPYEQLLLRLGETEHQSCLLLLSREAPLSLCRLMRTTYPIGYLQLLGLPTSAGQRLLQAQLGAQAIPAPLVDQYSGNPLALHLVADAIKAQYNGRFDHFLQGNVPIFEEIQSVLDEQFARLSAVEKLVIRTLLEAGHPTTYSALSTALMETVSTNDILCAVRALERRSLLERQTHHRQGKLALPQLVQAYARAYTE